MPYWTSEEERVLVSMAETGKTVADIAQYFSRSDEAIQMKLRRLGLNKKVTGISNKVTTSITTTEPMQPVEAAERLLDFEGTMKLLLGAIGALNQPNLSAGEVKRLRLLISSIKSYGHLMNQYHQITGGELEDSESRPQEEKNPADLQQRIARLNELVKKASE